MYNNVMGATVREPFFVLDVAQRTSSVTHQQRQVFISLSCLCISLSTQTVNYSSPSWAEESNHVFTTFLPAQDRLSGNESIENERCLK